MHDLDQRVCPSRGYNRVLGRGGKGQDPLIKLPPVCNCIKGALERAKVPSSDGAIMTTRNESMRACRHPRRCPHSRVFASRMHGGYEEARDCICVRDDTLNLFVGV
jgi:hypothetical protein